MFRLMGNSARAWNTLAVPKAAGAEMCPKGETLSSQSLALSRRMLADRLCLLARA
jgi:hypothetical protein